MVAVEQWWQDVEEEGAHLRLVQVLAGTTSPGPGLHARRARRAQRRRHRAVALVCVALIGSLSVLSMSGVAFGGSTSTGMPTDLEGAGVLAPGTTYVVQPGDTVGSIARLINPLDPRAATLALRSEVGSNVVVAGEHLITP